MSRKKTEYLQCRINPEDKELIKKGAKARGFGEVSDYVRSLALEAAKKDIEEASLKNKVVLSEKEWNRFLEIMETSMKPNDNLKRAFEKLDKLESNDHQFLQENVG